MPSEKHLSCNLVMLLSYAILALYIVGTDTQHMQLLLCTLLVQTHSICPRYNQSLGEEAAPNCNKMTGIVHLVFCKLGTQEAASVV